MTIDSAISSAAPAVTVVGPYALVRIIPIPPADGQALDILT